MRGEVERGRESSSGQNGALVVGDPSARPPQGRVERRSALRLLPWRRRPLNETSGPATYHRDGGRYVNLVRAGSSADGGRSASITP